MNSFEEKIFSIRNVAEFNSLAMEIFRYQTSENSLYAKYVQGLGLTISKIKHYREIPFLPIEFFKTHDVICGDAKPGLLFESSGTSGQQTSKHYITSESLYKKSFRNIFNRFYGSPENKCILALLPSYLERGNSSLVYMMNDLILSSKHPDSGFYLDELEKLSHILEKRNKDGVETILLGVSFALLDLAEQFGRKLEENIILIETGGMKGRKKEMIRKKLHTRLKKAFRLNTIHSEYGMTELLSQAYMQDDGIFKSPPWMKMLCRDIYDPLTLLPTGKSGAINIIDLANLYSCSFIATGDIGRVFPDGSFEINGRMDHAEIRGCNLMVI